MCLRVYKMENLTEEPISTFLPPTAPVMSDCTKNTLHSIVTLTDERQFVAAVILGLGCAICALFGMVAIVGIQIKRLAELLRAAREAAQPEAKTALLPPVSGKLTPKKSKKTHFEDTSCAGPRDLDEEEI